MLGKLRVPVRRHGGVGLRACGWALALCAWTAPLAQSPAPAALCGDGLVEGLETCDPPGSAVTDCCCAVCERPGSGDPSCRPCSGCRPDCTYCGDGVVDAAEQCDDGNFVEGDACDASCRVICGDGVIVPGYETCDPPDAPLCDCCYGHDQAGGSCTGASCTAAICALDASCCDVKWDWDCADLAAGHPACGCCQIECASGCFYCGDALLAPEETCEPPGGPACDCCAAHAAPECSNPICAAAVCALDPACCAAGWSAGCAALAAGLPGCSCCQTACGPDCVSCGDTIVNAQETCDPPGADVCNCCTVHEGPGHGCNDKYCAARVCGVDPSCCEDGWDAGCVALAAADPVCSCCNDCRGDCTYCGDAVLTAPETCDPAITRCDCFSALPWPGCSNLACTLAVCAYDPTCCAVNWDAICVLEAQYVPACVDCARTCGLTCHFCGDGIVDPGEACDDRNLAGEDGCSPACAFEVCGNAVLDGGEQCDDGNLLAGDGCDPGCRHECGNAIVDPGEQCDDGNDVTEDGCEPNCSCTDSDGDGACNPADDCPHSANPGGGVAPFDQTLRAAAKNMFYWPHLADVAWIRGDLSALPSYGVIESGAITLDAVLWAPAVPAPGAGFYWVVRPACPLTSWSSMGPGECHGPPGCAPGGRDANFPP